jgi:hypothetical protein
VPSAINRQHLRPIFAVLSLSLASCGSPTDRTLEETFEQFYTIEPSANVTVKNGDGVVFVYGSNANEMWVQAVKKAYTRERLKQVAVNISMRPGSVSIETNFPRIKRSGFSDRSGTVDYTIVIPALANISLVESGNGEVLVDGMHGQTVRARLGSGRMFGHNCFSNVEFTMVRGTLTLAYDWWEPGKFSIKTDIARGNAWAFLPIDAVCHLVAETGQGEIANDFDETAGRESTEVRKIETLIHGGGEAAITMRAKEGNIKIVEASR